MAENPVTPLASIENFYEDQDHVIITCDGKTTRVHRCTPLARAYAGMRDLAVSNEWQRAIGDAQSKGVEIPSETANVFEKPRKIGLFGRMLGKKPPEQKPEEKQFIPGMPDYAGTAAAVGIPQGLGISGLVITKAGAEITLSNKTKITVDPKSDLARRAVILLEEMDAIGIEKVPAMEVLNGGLERPVVRLPKFGQKQPEKKGLAANVREDVIDSDAPGISESGPVAVSSGIKPAFDPDEAVDLDYGSTTTDTGESFETARPLSAAGSAPSDSPDNEVLEDPNIPAAPGEAPSPAPETELGNTDDMGEIAETFSMAEVVQLMKEGDILLDKDLAAKNAAANSSEGDSSAATDVSSTPQSPLIDDGTPIVVDSADEQAGVSQLGGANPTIPTPPGGQGQPPHWSASHVKVAQVRVPKKEGPFTLAAKGEQVIEGKSPTLGQFNVSKEDYDVIKWLSNKGREARYKVEIEPSDDGLETESQIPKAHISGVHVLNESKQFTPVDWKKCREEFELANKKVQLPAEREAQKSAVIESQVATPTIAGSVKEAPPKMSDIEAGDLPLPKLRPLSIPKAPTIPGPSFDR